LPFRYAYALYGRHEVTEEHTQMQKLTPLANLPIRATFAASQATVDSALKYIHENRPKKD